MKKSPFVTSISLAAALSVAPLAVAQEPPGAPTGEAKPPAVGAPPPGASERGVATGKEQARGAEEVPADVPGEAPGAADAGVPRRGEMAKPPLPDPLLPEDEESE
jgi:hypothetical protein